MDLRRLALPQNGDDAERPDHLTNGSLLDNLTCITLPCRCDELTIELRSTAPDTTPCLRRH
jgi:hypothetical protein